MIESDKSLKIKMIEHYRVKFSHMFGIPAKDIFPVKCKKCGQNMLIVGDGKCQCEKCDIRGETNEKTFMWRLQEHD